MTTQGRLRGRGMAVRRPSASLVKAMLLVAYLRTHATLEPSARADLDAMIRTSDNAAALRIYPQVGKGGLHRVGRAVGMRRLDLSRSLFDTQVTAADQARLFFRLDRVVPRDHRRYARRLLSEVAAYQSWGIPPAARRRGLEVRFKGGWRKDIVHQAAELRGRDAHISLAVLTVGNPSQRYGEETIAGITRRVLGDKGTVLGTVAPRVTRVTTPGG